jgi:hypothetical protein
LLDQKETKNQEQTIAPHKQHGIAFVRSSRAFSQVNSCQIVNDYFIQVILELLLRKIKQII